MKTMKRGFDEFNTFHMVWSEYKILFIMWSFKYDFIALKIVYFHEN